MLEYYLLRLSTKEKNAKAFSFSFWSSSVSVLFQNIGWLIKFDFNRDTSQVKYTWLDSNWLVTEGKCFKILFIVLIHLYEYVKDVRKINKF